MAWIDEFQGGSTGRYDADKDPMDQARRWRAMQQNLGATAAMPSQLSLGYSPAGTSNSMALWPGMQDLRRRYPAGPESSTFDPSTLGGADHPMHQGMFSKGLDSLGGWAGLANLGLKGYGLYQTSQQIGDLRDWREKLNQRADAAAALDQEKFGLVKQEYDTRSKKRQADMWSQRLDPSSGATANPYMSNLIQDA